MLFFQVADQHSVKVWDFLTWSAYQVDLLWDSAPLPLKGEWEQMVRDVVDLTFKEAWELEMEEVSSLLL